MDLYLYVHAKVIFFNQDLSVKRVVEDERRKVKVRKKSGFKFGDKDLLVFPVANIWDRFFFQPS